MHETDGSLYFYSDLHFDPGFSNETDVARICISMCVNLFVCLAFLLSVVLAHTCTPRVPVVYCLLLCWLLHARTTCGTCLHGSASVSVQLNTPVATVNVTGSLQRPARVDRSKSERIPSGSVPLLVRLLFLFLLLCLHFPCCTRCLQLRNFD